MAKAKAKGYSKPAPKKSGAKKKPMTKKKK